MEFQTAYGPKIKLTTTNNDPTMTKVALAEQLDVNNIIKKYNKTGILKNAENYEAIFGDFNETDFQESLNTIIKAEELFINVPSKIRAQFENSPGRFIDFATNPENLQQMRDWGLAHAEEESNPVKVEITNQPEPEKEQLPT